MPYSVMGNCPPHCVGSEEAVLTTYFGKFLKNFLILRKRFDIELWEQCHFFLGMPLQDQEL